MFTLTPPPPPPPMRTVKYPDIMSRFISWNYNVKGAGMWNSTWRPSQSSCHDSKLMRPRSSLRIAALWLCIAAFWLCIAASWLCIAQSSLHIAEESWLRIAAFWLHIAESILVTLCCWINPGSILLNPGSILLNPGGSILRYPPLDVRIQRLVNTAEDCCWPCLLYINNSRSWHWISSAPILGSYGLLYWEPAYLDRQRLVLVHPAMTSSLVQDTT